MNYYKRHLGDYAKDTGHLTALEHGIYTLLLDWYYTNERPIPVDKTVRIARGNPEETQTVLEEFFKLTDAGWTHGYADRVIAEYNEKAERNRESGKMGGRPRKTQTVSESNPDVTLATSHKPLATSQEEKLEADASSSPTKKAADCPHQSIIELYHEILPANPRMKVWSDKRARSLATRWREDPKRQSLDYWRRFFGHVAASAFLTGRTPGDRPFLPGLDWMVQPENFAKIIEGRYNGRGDN